MSSKLIKHLAEVRNLPLITLGLLTNTLKDEALVVMCLISILPFMQPIPIPGVSTVLGFVALLQGFGLMFFRKPLLTQKMKDLKITHEKFEIILKAATKLTTFTDKISIFPHPWAKSRTCHFISGLSIVLSAAFLSLPLPIPFSNFVPALSIGFICVGLLEEDIFLVIIGLSITLAVIWMGFFSYHLIVEKFPVLLDLLNLI